MAANSGSRAGYPVARTLGLAVTAAGLLAAGIACMSRPAPAMAPEPAPVVAPAAAPAAAPAPAPPFNADRAFADLKKQVEFGPRVPNLASHRACRDFLVKTLKPLADQVEQVDFTEKIRGTTLQMANVLARWKGKNPNGEGVLLLAHWDTRPTADQERDPARQKMPIPGANDGASGVAVLLEMARGFKQTPPPVPVMLLLVDGEDYGPGVEDMFLGARYFANHLPADAPKRGVLIDMIGDKQLQIPQEAYSQQNAGDVLSEVYAAAQKLGYQRNFPNRAGFPIEDDHLPLQAKGLKVIDLIDFNYGPGHSWWHTLADTPDKCSPTSLKAVGETLLEWVYTR